MRRLEKRYLKRAVLVHRSNRRHRAEAAGQPNRGCAGKKRILGEESARIVARQMSDRFGGEFEGYFCEDCRYWHIGHAKRRVSGDLWRTMA
jgi:hypothetical protein